MTYPSQLPLPPHYHPERVGQVWPVAYQALAEEASSWAARHAIQPAADDSMKVALIAIDVQNTFCIPGFELFVGGCSGQGAVEDNRRLCEFIYHNLGVITQISLTLDTHSAIQIFHPAFLVDAAGHNPPPLTAVTLADVQSGRWQFNPKAAAGLGVTPEYGQAHLLHYTQRLHEQGKYDLTVWPYHVMMGSIGHALVSAVEEAIFFHTMTRFAPADFMVKGNHPLTEHYSAIGPEVLTGPDGKPIAERSRKFIEKLVAFDAVVIAGQAKSHCVAWTIDDLLGDLRQVDESLVQKVYLLEDCTSPVVVPGVIDYTDAADEAFQRFAQAGMHIIRSTDPIEDWLS